MAPHRARRGSSRRLAAAAASLERACNRCVSGMTNGSVSPAELWFVENRRLLRVGRRRTSNSLPRSCSSGPARDESAVLLAMRPRVATSRHRARMFERPRSRGLLSRTAAAERSLDAARSRGRSKAALELALLERAGRREPQPRTPPVREARRCFTSLHSNRAGRLEGDRRGDQRDRAHAQPRPRGRLPQAWTSTRATATGRPWRAWRAAPRNESEREIAAKAVGLASQAMAHPVADGQAAERRSHVGYYLVDDGPPQAREGDRFPACRCGNASSGTSCAVRRDIYLGLVEATTVAVILLLVGGAAISIPGGSSRCSCCCHRSRRRSRSRTAWSRSICRRARLPELDFSEGVPADCKHVGRRADAAAERGTGRLDGRSASRSAFWRIAIRTCCSRCVTDAPDSDREVDDEGPPRRPLSRRESAS